MRTFIKLADTEQRATLEVTRTTSETREAQRERDEALTALRNCQMDERSWKEELETCKAAVSFGTVRAVFCVYRLTLFSYSKLN